jgi:Asp/Glu/hydantoin racemase
VQKHLGDWNSFNLVDESLLRNTIRDTRLTKETMRRVAEHVWSATDGGADAVFVTCSSIGPAVDATQEFCSVPLVRVDEGMAMRALELGNRVGVLATLSTTMEPTRDLISRCAAKAGKPIEIHGRVCDGAFEKLSRGEKDAHDAVVSGELKRLAKDVDVIVLAQASMARVLDGSNSPVIKIPVLSSPELGVLHLKSRLSEGLSA